MKATTVFSLLAWGSSALAISAAQGPGSGAPGGYGQPGGYVPSNGYRRPNGYDGPGGYGPGYVTQAVAENIVAQFKVILNHSNATEAVAAGKAVLNDNLVVISDSVYSVDIRPFTADGIVTTTADEYVQAIIAQPVVDHIDDYFVGITGRNRIVWHWSTQDIGSKQLRSKGFNLMVVDNQLKVQELRMEFNSIAWGQDIGFVCSRSRPTKAA